MVIKPNTRLVQNVAHMEKMLTDISLLNILETDNLSELDIKKQ
jgi:hypothetical protein